MSMCKKEAYMLLTDRTNVTIDNIEVLILAVEAAYFPNCTISDRTNIDNM